MKRQLFAFFLTACALGWAYKSRQDKPESVARRLVKFDGCNKLFIDAGANTGEALEAFAAGRFFECAVHSPPRCHTREWAAMTKKEKHARFMSLQNPSSWCVRSFEASPELLPVLRRKESLMRKQGMDVRLVEGAISNVSQAQAPRNIVTYARGEAGSSAVGLEFGDIHVQDPQGRQRPTMLSQKTVQGRSYALDDLVSQAMEINPDVEIAIRLDIEGSEWWAMRRLVEREEVLCGISHLFVEFHSAASDEQRQKLTSYGLRADEFDALKESVHRAMDRPDCKLKLYWRSFWASCGDRQRFEWRDTPQAIEGRIEDST